MSTAASLRNGRTRVGNLRYERIFFSGMAAFILLSVFVGFAQSYYLQRVPKFPHWKAFNSPPYPFIVHLHGVFFSAWVLLLITQTSLVAARRMAIHRRLGIAGFVLACLLVLVGLMVVCEAMARHVPLGHRSIGSQAEAIFNTVGFALLTYLGFRKRHDPAAHKRLMVLATIALLPAAFSRWPVFHDGTHLRAAVCCFALLVLIASYDFWSFAKVHSATLLGGLTLVLTNPPVVWIFTHNSLWFRLASLMQTAGRHLY
ncbi:MAG TPA: hypothetical protein VIW23_10655 [Candidatus Acidoferrum sp.]